MKINLGEAAATVIVVILCIASLWALTGVIGAILTHNL